MTKVVVLNCKYCYKEFEPNLHDDIMCQSCFIKLRILECFKCHNFEVLNYNGLCVCCNLYKQTEKCTKCKEIGFLNNGICINCKLHNGKKYCYICQTKQYFTRKGKCMECEHKRYVYINKFI